VLFLLKTCTTLCGLVFPLGKCDSALLSTEEWKYGAPQLLKLSLLYARYVA
jgi:hypothetical protein